MSDFNRLIGKLKKQKASFQKLLDVTLPKKVGNAAVNHFRKNFRDGGWNDNGLKKWKRTRREEISSARAEYRYGPLLSRQDHLMKSIHFTPESRKVIVSTDVKYAPYHNNGAEIRVTPKMRKFAWAKFFSGAKIAKGDSAKVRKQKTAKAGEEAEVWKRLALTKKSRLRIPKRRFMGHSTELDEKVKNIVEEETRKVLNS